jgi:uncharacterized protein (DUF885 family)
MRETFPEFNTTQGIPGARHDRLTDNSADAERAWWAREDQFLARLKEIDPATLKAEQIVTPTKLNLDVARTRIENLAFTVTQVVKRVRKTFVAQRP